MYLHTGYSVLHYNPSPLPINSFVVGQKNKTALDLLRVSFRLFNRQPKAVETFQNSGMFCKV